jgi:Flp pilus assembly pilin Flp
LRGQAALEYLLLLALASVLVIAATASFAAIKNGTEAAGKNASLALKGFAKGLLDETTGTEPREGRREIQLEIHSFDPYLTRTPAFFKITAYANGAAAAPPLEVRVTGPEGDELVTPSKWEAREFAISAIYPAQFYPAASGIYTITATCGNATATQDVLVR